MSNFNRDPKIELIRRLLAQAESAAKIGNEAEAESFNNKATQLISKYGVDQALLAAKGEIQDAIISRYMRISDNYAMDKRSLLNAIVHGLGAQVIFVLSLRPGTAQSYSYTGHVFAYEGDLERIELLYDLLSSQMLFGAAAAQVPSWESARSYRKSWMSGFAEAIRLRLMRTEKEAATDAGVGTDLVLFDRNTAVKLEFDLAHDPKKTKFVGRHLGGSGREDGYKAGKQANMGNNLGGARKSLAG